MVAHYKPPTPSVLDTGSTCVQFAIPDDANIRASWLAFAAYLGNPDNWQKSGAIDEWQCAALIADLIETGLETPCNPPAQDGAMQYITHYDIASGATAAAIELPDEFESIIVRGRLAAPSTLNLNLYANFDALEPANGYRTMATVNTGTGLTASNLLTNQMRLGLNGIARNNQTPPYSWLDAIVSDHWKPGLHSQVHGFIVNANSAERIDFSANNQVLRADGFLILYPSSSTFGACRLQTWGITGA